MVSIPIQYPRGEIPSYITVWDHTPISYTTPYLSDHYIFKFVIEMGIDGVVK